MKEIVIVPIGMGEAVDLEFLRRGIEKSFGMPCRVAGGIPLPPCAYNNERGQYLSTLLLERLEARGGNKQAVEIGVADVDLYVPELNFVFGEARPGAGEAVISLHRLRPELYRLPPDRELFERRALTEAVHELGHVFGLGHCTSPRCVMFFSNSLADTDRKGTELCTACRGKLGLER